MQPPHPGGPGNPYAPPVAIVASADAMVAGEPAAPQPLSVDGAFGRAWETMKRFLFRPFDLGKWFAFGFLAWIADLGEGNGVPNPSSLNNLGSKSRGGASLPDMSEAVEWIRDNVGAVVAIGIAAAILFASLTAFLMWLGARGSMMTLRAVALGHAQVGDHWRSTREPAWSYFGFNMLLWAITMPITLGLLAWACVAALPYLRGGSPDLEDLLYAEIPPVAGIFVAALAVAPFHFLGRNVLAPMLLHFGGGLRANWRRTTAVVKTSFGGVLLFLLVRMLIAFVQGILELVAIYATCCIGMLPVLHQTLCAPLRAFEKAYTLRVLESLGPAYKIVVDPPEGQWQANPYGPMGEPPPGAPPGPFGPYGPPPGYP